ncbi:MAG: LysM peptidoglycan-binding domain-containing protein [Candidatus Gastranaerophilales bacterium]|nr:LysM peptidoglycan-binding domain-containing protein [Candidatus Gastranaerophilales bacterium]
MKKRLTIFAVSSALIFLPFVTPLIITASSDGIDTDSTSQTQDTTVEDDVDDSGYGIDDSGFYMPISIEWQVMNAEISAAIQNSYPQNINITTGNAFEIPLDTLQLISGKGVALALQTGNEFAFSVSGKDVKNVSGSFRIALTAPSIPEDLLQSVTAGSCISRVFSMTDHAAYPFRVNAHMNLGAENAGKVAMLYCYDDTNRSMKLVGAYRITESGQAMFALNKGGEYIAVVADRVVGYTVADGDTLSHIAHRNGITLRALKAANPHIADYDRLRIGQALNIPLR